MASSASWLIAVLFATTFPVACAERPEIVVSVNSYSKISRTGNTYVLKPMAGVDGNSMEFAEFASNVEKTFASMGLSRVVDESSASVTIFASYGMDSAEKSYSYEVETGRSKTLVYTPQGVAAANTSTYGTETGRYTEFRRWIQFRAFDAEQIRHNQLFEVWKTDIVSSGSSSDMRLVLPLMLNAARAHIMTNTGRSITLSMAY